MNTQTQVKIIECVVLDFMNITSEALFKKSRDRRIVENRQLFHFLALKHTSATLSYIGKFNDVEYNHATVMHSRRVINNRIDTDSRFRDYVINLNTFINERISLTKRKSSTFNTIVNSLVVDIFKCENKEDLNNLLKSYTND